METNKTYNDRLCNRCRHRVRYRGKMGVQFGCNRIRCNYEPKKSSHVSPVEFIPDAGVLIVRTRHYSQVSEIILALNNEDGRTFKEEKEAELIKDKNLLWDLGKCGACDELIIGGKAGNYKRCPYCGAKFLEASGGA